MFKKSRRQFLLSSAALALAFHAIPAMATDSIVIGVSERTIGTGRDRRPSGLAQRRQSRHFRNQCRRGRQRQHAGGQGGRYRHPFSGRHHRRFSEPDGIGRARDRVCLRSDTAAGHGYGSSQRAFPMFTATPRPLRLTCSSRIRRNTAISSSSNVAESWYGSGFIKFITDLKASGDWTPKNNKVHIVQEQIAYTQVISKATQDAIAASGGEWELAAVTDIQFPVQDWSPVIAALKESDAV